MPVNTTATAMHFPTNAGFIYLTDELTNDRYLVDTGVTLRIIQCHQVPAHLVPFSREKLVTRLLPA
jgi:hypothetical protein